MKIRIFAFWLMLFLGVVNCSPNDDARNWPAPQHAYSFAIITDLHIGDEYKNYQGEEDTITRNNRAAVQIVNSLAERENLEAVFVLGDVSDSAEQTQFKKAREILNALIPNWFVLIGNHDIRQKAGSCERSFNLGEKLFTQTFSGHLGGENNNTASIFDDESHAWINLQNYSLSIAGDRFLLLDWVSRDQQEFYKCQTRSGATLHDQAGGTLPWLREQLALDGARHAGRIFLMQHHPIRSPLHIPHDLMTFDDDEASTLLDTLQSSPSADNIWGIFAGHLHRNWQGRAFGDKAAYWQVETADSRDTPVVTLVHVQANGTVDIQRASEDVAGIFFLE